MRNGNLGRPAMVGFLLLFWANGIWAQDVLPRQPEKRIPIAMRDKPWIGGKESVLEWLSEQTGLPVNTSRAKPVGTLTIMPSVEGAARQYTLPEVIDLLNGELLKQKLILVRRAQTFTIEPTDEQLDPAILPRILPRELEQYGNTELVSVVFSLPALVAEDFAQEVKGMLGPLGKVVPLAHANKLIVQDTVANLKRIQALVKENSQQTPKSQSGCYAHTCRYISARHAARILHELLGDPKELIQAIHAQLSVREDGSAPFDGAFEALLGASAMRMHYISVDERRNTVLVTGPADKIARAEGILKRIDAPQQQGQKPVSTGPFVLKTYSVPGGNAGVLAKALQEVYQHVPEMRIASVSNRSLMVWAGPGEQAEILAQLAHAKEQNSALEVLPLTALDATDVVDTLKGMLGGDSKRGAPYLQADTQRNAVVAKGTPEQINDVKIILKALEEGSAPPSAASTVVLSIEQGTGATLSVAEALERMLPHLLQNPIQIRTFGDLETKSLPPPKSEATPVK